MKIKVKMNFAALGYFQVATEACIQIVLFNVGLKKLTSTSIYLYIIARIKWFNSNVLLQTIPSLNSSNTLLSDVWKHAPW